MVLSQIKAIGERKLEIFKEYKNQIHIMPMKFNDVPVVTDCWVYNRLAIIRTSKHYEEWVASHYNLISTENHNFYFGETDFDLPSYYDPILKRSAFRLLKANRNNIVDKLCGQLSKGQYVVMHVKTVQEGSNFHEVLFYGFNKIAKCFYVVGLVKNLFNTYTIKFEELENTLDEIKEYFNSHLTRAMDLSLRFQFPATVFKLNKSYKPQNCALEAYQKIKKELYGGLIEKSPRVDFNGYGSSHKIFFGLSCLDSAYQMLQKEKSGGNDRWFRGITSAIKKLHEHRLMMLCSMRFLYKNWKGIMNEQTKSYISEYEICCENVGRWVNKIIKYDITHNYSILDQIINDIPNEYEKEKECLDSFVNKSIDFKKYNDLFV